MDANWPPTQGPAAAAAAVGDWRAELQPEARGRVVSKIFETLRTILPVSVPYELNELQEIARQFEERIYIEATNQSDYVRKISLKMLSMETNRQQAPGNAQVIPNQNYSELLQQTAGRQQQQAHPSIHQQPSLQSQQPNIPLQQQQQQLMGHQPNLQQDQLIGQHNGAVEMQEQQRLPVQLNILLNVQQTQQMLNQPYCPYMLLHPTHQLGSQANMASLQHQQLLGIVPYMLLQQNNMDPIQAQRGLQEVSSSISADSTAQTGNADADADADEDYWQEEIYQMVKMLKDQYFADLSELFNKICVKLQHVESIIPPPIPSEQYDRMKSFKTLLERILQMLQISKSIIQPAMRDRVPQYEKQIITILNCLRKVVQPQVQQ